MQSASVLHDVSNAGGFGSAATAEAVAVAGGLVSAAECFLHPTEETAVKKAQIPQTARWKVMADRCTIAGASASRLARNPF